jgi:hypothetical protein
MRLLPVPCHAPIRLFPDGSRQQSAEGGSGLAVTSAVGTRRHPSQQGYERDVLARIDCGSAAGRPPQ